MTAVRQHGSRRSAAESLILEDHITFHLRLFLNLTYCVPYVVAERCHFSSCDLDRMCSLSSSNIPSKFCNEPSRREPLMRRTLEHFRVDKIQNLRRYGVGLSHSSSKISMPFRHSTQDMLTIMEGVSGGWNALSMGFAQLLNGILAELVVDQDTLAAKYNPRGSYREDTPK